MNTFRSHTETFIWSLHPLRFITPCRCEKRLLKYDVCEQFVQLASRYSLNFYLVATHGLAYSFKYNSFKWYGFSIENDFFTYLSDNYRTISKVKPHFKVGKLEYQNVVNFFKWIVLFVFFCKNFITFWKFGWKSDGMGSSISDFLSYTHILLSPYSFQ